MAHALEQTAQADTGGAAPLRHPDDQAVLGERPAFLEAVPMKVPLSWLRDSQSARVAGHSQVAYELRPAGKCKASEHTIISEVPGGESSVAKSQS